ncbi:MAG: hypothetical protein H0U58_10085, partial [Chloroflexi bacterium]|nr:hypothetical protein [Chloroflexota bacterium]
GIVTGIRTVVTKRQETMAIAVLEDLQGTIEVVAFPRLYETTRPTWREGAILLVAGRIDHKGEEVSLLADLVRDWDDAAARGPEAFGREVAAGDRSNGRPTGGQRPPVAVGPGAAPSPRRETDGTGPPAAMPHLRPSEPVSTYLEPASAVAIDDDRHDRHDEPSVPDEARARLVADASADVPVAAGPEAILHVRFEGGAAPDRLVGAMEAVKSLLRDRPGATKVVIHVPVPGGGGTLPMELRRGVAYDAELLAEVRRRLGNGLVDVRLTAP